MEDNETILFALLHGKYGICVKVLVGVKYCYRAANEAQRKKVARNGIAKIREVEKGG